MTDTAPFAVGDHVQVLGKFSGVVTDFREDFIGLPYIVERDGRPGEVSWHHASDLERIDEEADPAAVSAGVAGPTPMDGGGTGATAESATEKPPLPTAEELATQVATLTRKVWMLENLQKIQARKLDLLTRIAEAQKHTNDDVLQCLMMLGIMPSPFAGEPPTTTSTVTSDGTFRHLDGTPRTTRRVHTKVVKSTSGYRHEISVEVTSDDPTWSVTDDVRDTLDLADKDARRHIIDAEYRDTYGLPGHDET